MTSRHVYISATTWSGKPAAEMALQRRDDLHPLQRVQPHLGDGRVQLEADRPVLADRPDHVQHDLRRRLEGLASGPPRGCRSSSIARGAASGRRGPAGARRARRGAGAAATGSSLPARCHSATTSRLRSRNASRQACRWILPLEVLGMLPARTSTIESTTSSCSRATSRRIAPITWARLRPLVPFQLQDDHQLLLRRPPPP